MTTRGVVYMAWGANAINSADASIRSLWEHAPGLPVLVVGDAAAQQHFAVWRDVQTRTLDVDPFDERSKRGHKFLAGRIKPFLPDLAPFDQALYVDADTTFVASPERGFDLLARWDFVLAEQSLTSRLGNAPFLPTERAETIDRVGTGWIVYHNSGMLFWRKGRQITALMQLWSQEWARYGDWDEQIALLRALLRWEGLFLTVPYTWNCARAPQATLLHHTFGNRVARVDRRVEKARPARLTPDQQRQPRPAPRVRFPEATGAAG